MNKKILLQFIFAFIFMQSATASTQGAQKFLDSFLEKIVETSTQEKNIEQIRSDIVQLVKNNVNIKYISKFVLGRHWNRTTQKERDEFAKIYEEYLILTFAPRFQGYSGEIYELKKINKITDGKYTANISLITKNKTELDIEIFIIEEPKNNYKIVDVSGEGISFATTQRAEFSSLISAKGVKGLLVQLDKKVAQMKNNN